MNEAKRRLNLALKLYAEYLNQFPDYNYTVKQLRPYAKESLYTPSFFHGIYIVGTGEEDGPSYMYVNWTDDSANQEIRFAVFNYDANDEFYTIYDRKKGGLINTYEGE